MKTVHFIGNAHLDPVWLWGKAGGVDAVIATARSACDRLDEYPEFVFTCSASWFHQTVEEIDPALFARIRAFVAQGRWQLVGGMVIQPDCNLPSADGFARQFAEGQGYFRSRFGRSASVGYNVDSFGHTAHLPRFLREAGLDSYVFMRPGPQEKDLPANLFRWRSPDGAEVNTFRIVPQYAAWSDQLDDHVKATLAAMPPGVEETMCFFGVGDHGGGPTRRQIEWIRSHAQFEGARLIFSHPRAFFDAVAPRMAAMPVVEGELQHHAIGCYSVERRIKVSMRRAEAKLMQAERAGCSRREASPADLPDRLAHLWQPVLFNHFHDMLGGTCIAEASELVAGENLAAQAGAEDLTTSLCRRASRALAEPGLHKVVVFNPALHDFDGLVAHEAWGAPADGVVLDERGNALPCQTIEPVSKTPWVRRLLFRVAVPAGQWHVLRVAAPGTQAAPPAPAAAALIATSAGLSAGQGRVAPGADGLRANDWDVRLDVHDDPSDTWSHSCGNRFEAPKLGSFAWGDWEPVETGPIRAALRGRGASGGSRAWCRVMIDRDSPLIRLRLSVVWAEERRRLVLRLVAPRPLTRRVDLVSGGPVDRALDGREYPLGGGLLVHGPAQSLAVIAPEVFSVSAAADAVSLTLLRSPFLAHHDPYDAALRPDHPVSDQGWHDFDVVLWPGCPDARAAADMAEDMLAPPIAWDVTG